MKRENFDNDNIFKVPEHYFEELPGRIQEKIRSRERSFWPEVNWQGIIKFSVSIAAVLFLLFYFHPEKSQNDLAVPEQILAQVNTDDVIAYLELTDLNVDDFLAETGPGNMDLWEGDEDPLIDDLNLNENQLEQFLDTY